MATKTFKARPTRPAERFNIEGATGDTFEVICKQSVPGAAFLDFLSGIEDTEDFSAMARVTKDVLNACIANQDEFWAFVSDPAQNIDVETLAEISGYMSELFSGERPLDQPAG